MTDFKQVEYAPLDSLGSILAIGGSEVTIRAEGESVVATVALPTGYVETDHVTVTAPSLGLLVRALELVTKPKRPASLPPPSVPKSITVGPDGELVDAAERELRLWSMIRRKMGPVLELQEMPKVEPGRSQVQELALWARQLGEEANGYSLPDHLLKRAAMAIDIALRSAKGGYMPSAALLVDFIAAQFEQSSDGETDARKQIIWTPIDTTQRFGLPEPWGQRFGKLARHYELFGRGGAEGQRYLATRCMAVAVPEEVYQAAVGYPWFEMTASWQTLAGDGGEVVRLDQELERLDMGLGQIGVRVGPAWIDSFYLDALAADLGVQEVVAKVTKAGPVVVAPGIAIVMGLKPEEIENVRANGPTKDPRPDPEFGKHYTVTHDCGGGWSQALVRITYKSDQRMLAVCEARRRGRDEPWLRDGSEAEWSTSYGEWREASEAEVAEATSAS